MPDTQPLASVVGTDNVSPVYNPASRWQIWNINEIYLGTVGTGKYVPQLGDEVHEIMGASITRYVVAALNEESLVPTLRQENRALITDPLSENDVLLGVGPGWQSDTYRVYVDTSVMPYRMAVDARLKVGGSQCSAAKLFKGADISDTGTVVSGVYNANGHLISENVALELVASTIITNSAIKVVAPCHTTSELLNGEVLTAVFYDTSGFVVSKRQLLVELTAFIRSTDANRLYVSSISLECPFMSSANTRLIQYPLNVPLSALNLIGVVNYSDGSSARMAVDGTKFSVAGLNAYAATIVGQKSQLVLKYALGLNEVAYGAHQGSAAHISEIYEITTVNTDGAYAVQLYAYPVWVNAASGYRLSWFLYDLERSVRYEVTPDVTLSSAYTFAPLSYGVRQTLNAVINLKDVNGTYRSFVHTQYLSVLLNKPGTARPNIDSEPNWYMSVTAGLTSPYGPKAWATYYRRSGTEQEVRLVAGAATPTEWLERVYWSTAPLFDANVEAHAPLPTHFALVAGEVTTEYPLSDWNAVLALGQTLTNNATVYLRFFKRTSETDLQLSIAGLPLFAVDADGAYI